MAYYVRLEGVEELLKKLESLESLEPLKAAMNEAANTLKVRLQQYPPTRRLKRSEESPAPWKSKRQKRYFFWALKHGKIQVPYQRGSSPGSERFGENWAVSSQNNGLTMVIENTTSYGPLLMDKASQSLYMKQAGWPTVEDVIDEEGDEVVRRVREGGWQNY